MTKHNLPVQATSFIGRTQEITTLIDLLDDENCRLLTVLGAGGIGKTRLAIEVAYKQTRHFSDGICFVDLKTLSSADTMLPAIADILRIPLVNTASLLEQVLSVLKKKQLLLLMDNFEHLLEGVEILAEIVNETSAVKVLVTSRAALNLHIEWIYHVHGLDYPQNTDANIEIYSAIELFAERARQINSSFSLDDNIDCVLGICKLVEGMPLGIELATAWLKHLSCQDVIVEIERNLDFLATNLRGIPDHHRSLRAVFDYSWQLLTDDEQLAFMRFSIFRGGCTRESATAITGVSLNTLSGLVDKSLLRLNPDGRYDIHELLRQYVEEKLLAPDLVISLPDAHCAYYLTLLYELEADIKGHRQIDGLNEIEADIENIRIAWTHAIQNRYFDLIAESMECLLQYYTVRTRWLERSSQTTQALNGLAPVDGEEPHLVWHRLNFRDASYTNFIATEQEIERAKHNLEIARRLGNSAEEAFCLRLMSQLLRHNHLSETVLDYAQQALVIFETIGNDFSYRGTLTTIASYYRAMGQIDKCLDYWWQVEKLARKNGDNSGVAHALSLISYITYATTGNYKLCQSYLREAYDLRYELKVLDGISLNAAFLSQFTILSGDVEQAKDYAEEAGYMATGFGWNQYIPIASYTLGLLATVEENYVEALHYHHRVLEDDYYSNNTFQRAIGLALAYCGLRDFRSAKQSLLSSYSDVNSLTTIFQTQILPPAALIFAHTRNYQLATECLGLAFEYPGSHAIMMEGWALMRNLINDLKQEMGDQAYSIHYKKGVEQDLEAFIHNIVWQLRGKDISQAIQEVNKNLVEPLTNRELEVLQLIANGLSNREVAKRLFVSLGTIKKHNNNIYGKLQASSRTQAIAQAKEIGLLP